MNCSGPEGTSRLDGTSRQIRKKSEHFNVSKIEEQSTVRTVSKISLPVVTGPCWS